jgi:uncharacterized protein YihD (DUF1040 family)
MAWQALSPEQIYKIYQTYIKELSRRLVELNQEGCDSEGITEQVEKLTKEVVRYAARVNDSDTWQHKLPRAGLIYQQRRAPTQGRQGQDS